MALITSPTATPWLGTNSPRRTTLTGKMEPVILLLTALSCLIAAAASAKSLLAVQVEQEMAMLALQAASEERVAKLNGSYTAAPVNRAARHGVPAKPSYPRA